MFIRNITVPYDTVEFQEGGTQRASLCRILAPGMAVRRVCFGLAQYSISSSVSVSVSVRASVSVCARQFPLEQQLGGGWHVTNAAEECWHPSERTTSTRWSATITHLIQMIFADLGTRGVFSQVSTAHGSATISIRTKTNPVESMSNGSSFPSLDS